LQGSCNCAPSPCPHPLPLPSSCLPLHHSPSHLSPLLPPSLAHSLCLGGSSRNSTWPGQDAFRCCTCIRLPPCTPGSQPCHLRS
jgi:hypothetical protein